MVKVLIWLALAVPTFSFGQKQGTVTVKKGSQDAAAEEIIFDSTIQVYDDTIYTVSQIMPEYAGGAEKMYKYLSDNLKVPHPHLNITRAYIRFVIEKNGEVTNVEVLRPVDLDETIKESWIKTIKNMTKWKPGEQYGKTVRVKYTLPVLFKIN